MEAEMQFLVVDAVSWNTLELDPGQVVKLADLQGREEILMELGALEPLPSPTQTRRPKGILV